MQSNSINKKTRFFISRTLSFSILVQRLPDRHATDFGYIVGYDGRSGHRSQVIATDLSPPRRRGDERIEIRT
jgi:hypothetical protein